MIGIDSYSNISFGLHNPQAALERAEKLKKLYAQKGITYLMPDKVWNDKKIAEKISIVDQYIKYHNKRNDMTPSLLQKAVNFILPQNEKNTIQIKDLSEIENSMRKRHFDEDTIKSFKDVGGLTISANKDFNTTEIFVNFNDAIGDDIDRSNFNAITLHELQHALKDKFQNINASQTYNYYMRPTEQDFDATIFHKFETKFYPYINLDKKMDLNDKNFYKCLKVSSRDELYKKFDTNLDKVEKEYSSSLYEHLKNKKVGKFSTKDFFEYMKNRANDEKFSYKTETDVKTPQQYTTRDFFSKLYSEMARYFAQKKNSVNG